VNSCTGPTNYDLQSTFTVDPAASVPAGTTCVTAANNSRDGWFKFTATAASTTIIGTVVSRNLAIAVYTGTCGAMNPISCVNSFGNGGTETTTFATVVGTTYYIRLIRVLPASGTTMTGTITILSPLPNDNCSGAISLTPSVPGGACSQTCGNTYGATASTPTSACTGSANWDVWYSFTATQFQHIINVGGSPQFNPVIELLSGTCGSLVSLACADATGDGGFESLTYSNFTAGVTYYVRIYDFGPTLPGTFEFNICITTTVLPTCPTSLGLGVVNVAVLPYSSSGRSTTGMGNEITTTNVITCGSNSYFSGNDEVFIFTPAATGNLSVNLTSASTNVGIALYRGCPYLGQGGTCIAYSQSASGNQFLCANVQSGFVYYLIVDRNSAGGSIPSYNISITAPVTGNNGATCATAVVIPSLPYTISNQTTTCKGNDYTNASSGSCISLYESGEDMVFQFTAASAQCLYIALSNTSSLQAGFQLYQNCPGSGIAVCLGYVGGGNVSSNFTLPSAGTYFIIVDSWAPPDNITFDLSVSSTPGASPNDFPCNATPLPLGVSYTGDNSCSNGLLEPVVPSCWTSGAVNTVWYAVTPTGPNLTVTTTLGSLTNTQIALYSGSCGSLTQVAPLASSCNTNAIGCSGVLLSSQINVTGLIPFQTYYIRVDGELDLTGTFGIIATDGSSGLPFVYGQDCGAPLPVCQNSISVGSPGYTGNGNYCDFGTGTNCVASGEVSSAWYRIPIGSAGTLSFDIIPNDWPGAPSIVGSDFNFAIWEIGLSGLTCSQLASTAPVRCNYDLLGVTGLSATGNSPASYPGFNAAYETSIPVVAGQIYILVISNYSGNGSGFALNFTSIPDPITYISPASGLNWTGVTNTNWSLAGNWGSCTFPTCGIDATISSGPANQPVLSVNQTVNNLIINAGATLTINANVTLSVCGNFTNAGNLVAMPGSTVKFIGTGPQTISGNFTGANRFANFIVQKPSGTVTLLNNIDINEDDSLKSGLFNANAKYIRVKENLFIGNGTSTHISPATGSTYEFNGNAPQTFTNIGDEINFSNIFINQSATSSLIIGSGAFNNLNVLGILTLSNGKIVTGSKEVVVKNTASASIVSYNVNSYVEGNLRRYMAANATGVFDFPVGHSLKGYQLARVDFTSATQIPQLLAYFTPWVVIPNGPVSSECNTANYSLSPVLDHGYWTINASSNANTGTYSMTLFNRNYTNPLSGWTVMKRTPSGSGAWALDGTCVISSTANSTQRTGMFGFSDFASAQNTTPLPIELISFTARVKATGVLTEWTTASEINNNYFVVERSRNGIEFSNAGMINASGTTTERNSYSFFDTDPGTGIIYYRLKQVDYDGNFSYSDIVAVKLGEIFNEISVYPNPANDIIRFEYESEKGTTVIARLTDLMGKVVYEEIIPVNKGMNSLQLDILNQPEGMYYLNIIDREIYKGRFVKF
jgi:hypothetical protein